MVTFQEYLAFFTPQMLDAIDADAHVATMTVYYEYVDYVFRSQAYAR